MGYNTSVYCQLTPRANLAEQILPTFLTQPTAEPILAREGKPLEPFFPELDIYVGKQIGPFQIVERIGKGGMGLVYLAEQKDLAQRQVAIKVIRPELATKSMLARFEAERRALAIMDHPNIARVFDAGQTEFGHPYFVMELVRGVPITNYCDQARFSPLQRLELMVAVCNAVQHAHQKGIIHRDIKPSNVLVTEFDGKPVPKIIDFGIAKAIDAKLSEQSIHTDFGAVVGTLEYMSPEQAGLEPLDIDTRSDVYSLGVLMYELLTGSTPIDRSTLQAVAFVEQLRTIREVDPPRPSTRISSTDNAPTVAANRSIEPARLQGFVRGDLDWIAMRALEKDRDRRYQTANELSQEIQRFLKYEPVQAGPPTVCYRLSKFLRRNRTVSIATGLVLLSILGGSVATTFGWVESRRQYALAAVAEAKVREAKSIAESRLNQVVKGMEILGSVFDDLNPQKDGELDPDLRSTLAKRLETATSQLDVESLGEPLLVARLQYRLGSALTELGYPKRAADVFRKASKIFENQPMSTPVERLKLDEQLAVCLNDDGQFAAALELQQKTLLEKQRILGEFHTNTLATMQNIAVTLESLGKRREAEKILKTVAETLERTRGKEFSGTLTAKSNLASLQYQIGDVENAITSLEEIVETRRRILGTKHVDTAFSIMALAKTYLTAGRTKQSLPLIEECWKIRTEILGQDHPDTLVVANNLATIWQRTGKLKEGTFLLEEVLQYRQLKLGADHPDTLASMSTLAVAYGKANRLEEAVQLSKESLAKRIEFLGPKHPDTVKSKSNLASLFLSMKDFKKAISLFEESLGDCREVFGAERPDTLASMNNLAIAYEAAGQFEKADETIRKFVESSERIQGRNHPTVLMGIYNLAKFYRNRNQLETAIPLFEDVLTREAEVKNGLPHNCADLPELMVQLYEVVNRLDDAEAQARKVLTDYEKRLGTTAQETLRMKAALGRLKIYQGQLEEADVILRDCLTLRQEHEKDTWTLPYTQTLLGATLLKRKQYSEGERLLLEGYEGMKSRSTEIPVAQRASRLGQARSWLVKLYRATEREEEAIKWDTAPVTTENSTQSIRLPPAVGDPERS